MDWPKALALSCPRHLSSEGQEFCVEWVVETQFLPRYAAEPEAQVEAKRGRICIYYQDGTGCGRVLHLLHRPSEQGLAEVPTLVARVDSKASNERRGNCTIDPELLTNAGGKADPSYFGVREGTVADGYAA